MSDDSSDITIRFFLYRLSMIFHRILQKMSVQIYVI